MSKSGIYIKTLIKFIFIWTIMAGIIIYFFPNKIVFWCCAVMYLGAFSAASEEVKKAETEESKQRLKEGYSEASNVNNFVIEDTETDVPSTPKKSNQQNSSIFDDIELD